LRQRIVHHPWIKNVSIKRSMPSKLSLMIKEEIPFAIVKIEKTVSHFNNADDLKYDYLAWDSVIREFQIIGEAAKRLIDNSVLAEETRQVVDFRNLIIHHYFGIDEDAVWGIVHKDLPDFKKMIVLKIEIIEISLKEELINALIEENRYLDFVVEALEKLDD
jgi:uncharacterized protein with HEPN domain